MKKSDINPENKAIPCAGERKCAKIFFGMTDLHDYHADAIKSFIEGRDVLSIARTCGVILFISNCHPDELALIIAPIAA